MPAYVQVEPHPAVVRRISAQGDQGVVERPRIARFAVMRWLNKMTAAVDARRKQYRAAVCADEMRHDAAVAARLIRMPDSDLEPNSAWIAAPIEHRGGRTVLPTVHLRAASSGTRRPDSRPSGA